MKRFTDLDAWKIGIELLQEIYRLTAKFPAEERYEITSQIRRASKSILANLAEGCGRFTYADRAGKFVISRGECAEVEAFLRMAISLEFLTKSESAKALDLADRTGQLLSGLISSTKENR
jgi:four helix bundle protein